ncbi:MAG: membrane protein of unknown function [Promethearchaeota archaeon]|nr:MAG: membrane protein of unknown function [Candidatus Lokiarchaeota archaeon]
MLVKNISLRNSIRSLSNLNVFLSVFAVAFGIIFFSIPVQILLYDIFGYLAVLAFFIDIILLFFIEFKLDKAHENAYKLQLMSYIFLVLIIIGTLLRIFGIMFVNFFLEGIILVLASLMQISGFFLIHIFGIYFSLLIYENIDEKEVWER